MASLLSLIKQAIFSRTQSDVTIHERTFVTELLEAEHKGDPFALYDFFPRKYRGKNLVITRHLIFIFRCIVLLFIGLIYIVYDLIHKIVTGQWKSKRLSPEVLKRRVPDTKWAKRLHADKWRGMPSSTGVNAIIFTFIIIQAILLLVFALNFLIREVVLPDNEARINNKGVVSIDQGALETQHFFLLNSATCWTSSGIAVSKGDRVYISASGSMYSDVGDMSTAADENDSLKYPRSYFYRECLEDTTKPKMDTAVVCCIYGRDSGDMKDVNNRPYFGSLLYQISDEKHGPVNYNDNSKIVEQINFGKYFGSWLKDNKFHFDAESSGILYFSFNDILLDDKMIESIWKLSDTDSLFCDLWEMGVHLYNDTDNFKDIQRIPIAYDSKRNELSKAQQDTIKEFLKLKCDSLIWFADNLGEALINVRVERNIWNNDMPLYKKLLVAMYRGVNELMKPTASGYKIFGKAVPESLRHFRLYLAILIVIAYFTLDAIVSSCLKPKKCRTRPRRRRRRKSAKVQE